MSVSLSIEIGELEGYDFQIGHIVSTMHIVRQTTLSMLMGLSIDQIDYIYDAKSNSIGTILKHISAVEAHSQIEYFQKRRMDPDKQKEIIPFLAENLLNNQLKGNELKIYVKAMGNTRKKTLDYLKTKKDNWLYEEISTYGGDIIINNYYLLFHLIEHEINHRSQIRWIKSRMPK